jgi:lipopolysaccharide export LptBFGC system permease protein LptF
MPRRSSHALGRIVKRMEKLSPPRHREMVQGMVAELEVLADPAERTRFACGAIATIARLALIEYGRTFVNAPGRFAGVRESDNGANPGGSFMSMVTTRQLLRRHAAPFAVSLASLTVLLLAKSSLRRIAELRARGFSAWEMVQVFLLALPYTLALTIPMAVFLAVSWVFARLGSEGVLASAMRDRHGVRRLVAPVLGAAAVIAALTLGSNTQVVPRANARLGAVLNGAPLKPTDRTMTIGELREAAGRARAVTGAEAAARAAAYEVEIQKKFALAAACLVLALAAAATAIRFPRGGARLVLGASVSVFTGYYVSLVAGESLADRHVISPLPAMWMANVVLLAVVLLLLWRPSRSSPANGAETIAIGG